MFLFPNNLLGHLIYLCTLMQFHTVSRLRCPLPSTPDREHPMSCQSRLNTTQGSFQVEKNRQERKAMLVRERQERSRNKTQPTATSTKHGEGGKGTQRDGSGVRELPALLEGQSSVSSTHVRGLQPPITRAPVDQTPLPPHIYIHT